jgi:polyphosphate glucokinase
MTVTLGVDVGGTGIKAALVDTATGELLSERFRCDTPRHSTPEAVRDAADELCRRAGFGRLDRVGMALPGVVRGGALRTATNLDASWIGASLHDVFDGWVDDITFLNDADAAAIAEAEFGAARDVPGLAAMVTLGTGIGVGLLFEGRLVPNCELGQLEINGRMAESFASARAMEAGGLFWAEWAYGVSIYLSKLELVINPDLIVIGGGVVQTPDRWFPKLAATAELRLAQLSKSAGIVGAAMAARKA